MIAFSSSILYLLAKIKIKMYVYFLFWTYFSMCIGTSLLRHDSKAAVPLQSIGWTKAFCLSGNVKVHAFRCFFCEGGARAERGWSEGWNEGWSEGLRRSPKIDTNDKRCIFISFFAWSTACAPSLAFSLLRKLVLFHPPLHPSTCSSLPPLNTFIPVLKIRC